MKGHRGTFAFVQKEVPRTAGPGEGELETAQVTPGAVRREESQGESVWPMRPRKGNGSVLAQQGRPRGCS